MRATPHEEGRITLKAEPWNAENYCQALKPNVGLLSWISKLFCCDN